MEDYPGAELSLSQLVHALEKRLTVMVNRSCPRTILYEEEISRAETKLAFISISLRGLKNSFAPINRLPPEMLTLIQTFRESEKTLTNATAVCRYWRGTLISAPNLWNNIVCSEEASQDTVGTRVHTYFERSGSVPVSVRIHARASRFLSPHTERISRLVVVIDEQSDLSEIGEHLSKSAPLLQKLTLRLKQWRLQDLALPPGFFSAFLSSARTLNLCGAILSPGPCQLSKLTEFTLQSLLGNVTPTILLDTLEQMPLLRVFEAVLTCVDYLDPIPWDRVVTLPHLEEIMITINENRFTPTANPILPALCLPSARKVTLQSINARGAPSTPILPLLFKERLPNWTVTQRASAALDEGRNGIEFLGLNHSKLTLCANSNAPYAFTPLTYGGMPFESVRTLRVSFRSPTVDTVFFTHLLLSMKGLEWLQLKYSAVGPLDWWASEVDQARICPALSTLIIIDASPGARTRVDELTRARERAGVAIANVEIRHSEK